MKEFTIIILILVNVLLVKSAIALSGVALSNIEIEEDKRMMAEQKARFEAMAPIN